jgi:Zn-dependent alcohol dehydrogenase
MRTRAAVAAGQLLEIMKVKLEGPKAGEVLL